MPAVIATHYNGDMGESYTTPSTTSLLDTVFGNNYLTGWLVCILPFLPITKYPPRPLSPWAVYIYSKREGPLQAKLVFRRNI